MWKETSVEVYSVIWARHHKELCVHSSFTDPTGTGYDFSTGHPEIITEWGFKNSERPIIKHISKKEKESDLEWDYEYFIFCETEKYE